MRSIPIPHYNLPQLPRTKKSDIQLALWNKIDVWLVWGFAQLASEKEKLLVQQGNLLAPDNWMIFVLFFFFQAFAL